MNYLNLRGTTALCAVLFAIGGTSATANSAQPVDIPTQTLQSALLELSKETGLKVLASDRVVADKTAQAVRGNMTAVEALTQLLTGSGLTYMQTDDAAVVVTPLSFVSQNAQEPFDLGELILTSPDARAGLFGDRPVQDVPFSITGYTEELIEQTQAKDIGDAIANDPTVRNIISRNNSGNNFTVRGFEIFQQDVAVGGALGLAPIRRSSLEPYTRLEVFRGPNALLNGVPPSGRIGGIINLVPKRATDAPITDFKLNFETDGYGGGSIDVGRRFGPDNAFGLRLNAGVYAGDLAVDNSSLKNQVGSIAFDYDAGGPLRYSVDIIYQNLEYQGAIERFRLSDTSLGLPEAPDNRTNATQPWDVDTSESLTTIVGLEYDLTPNLTFSAKYGRVTDDDIRVNATPVNIIGPNGETSGGFSVVDGEFTRDNAEIGLNGRFNLGGVANEFAIQANRTTRDFVLGIGRGTSEQNALLTGGTIYNPITIDPVFVGTPAPTPLSTQTFTSVAFSNTATFLNDQLDVTFGLRWQRIESENFASGLVYDESEVTPALGVTYRLNDEMTFYASYSEGLTPGPTAPSSVLNQGEIFAPFISEQYELGFKYDNGTWGGSIAAFQITNPFGFVDTASNLFVVDGTIRNRGIEALISGNVSENLRLVGGVLLQDGKQTSTQDGRFDGNDAPGIPNVQFNLYGEYTLPQLPDLTLSGRLVYTASQAVTADNVINLPSWTRVDLGASYAFDAGGVPATLDIDVINVADSNYWSATRFNEFFQGTPRTVQVSLGMKF